MPVGPSSMSHGHRPGGLMYQQELAPLGSLTVSALVALLPLLTIFVLLGGLRWKAHWAGLASLVVAIIVAVAAYGMPVGLAVLSATQGAVFGLFPRSEEHTSELQSCQYLVCR